MKVLIAGGCGFIGSHAVRHFVESGDDVTVIDKLTYAGRRHRLDGLVDEDQFVQMDICDKPAVNLITRVWNPEVVVNFAAETHVDNSILDPSPFLRTNFEGASNLMTACRDIGALYVHLSTDEVYGDASGYGVSDAAEDVHSDFRGFTPEHPLRPRNPYSATKAAADMMLLANLNTFKQDFMAFRPSNNFGPEQHPEKFLPKLISCMLDGTSFPLYGDGSQMREWTYAGDTARGIRKTILTGARNRFHNLTSGFTDTNLNISKMVSRALRKRGIEPHDVVNCSADRRGHDKRYWIENGVDIEFTPFAEALEKTLDHYIAKAK